MYIIAIATHSIRLLALAQRSGAVLYENAQSTAKNATEFSLRYAAAAREQWFVDAEDIRDTFLRKGNDPAYAHISRMWSSIGISAGLPNAAKYLHARPDRMCSHYACSYYVIPAQNPLGKCKGCQEVYYCSAECQRRCVRSIIQWALRYISAEYTSKGLEGEA